MRAPALALALLMFPACTLPGYQGGPPPRSTQYTYPGRTWHPETRLPHSPVPTAAEPTDGGVFVFGLVFQDGSTAVHPAQYDSRATCEGARVAYAERQRENMGGAPIMTIKCHRAHELPGLQAR